MVVDGANYEYKLRCLLCWRDKFDRKSPHWCGSNFRKRKIKWLRYARLYAPVLLTEKIIHPRPLDKLYYVELEAPTIIFEKKLDLV